MMGSTMPSAQSLSDLMTLLQLLQAASDPKTSKATLALFVEERKKYDDAIAAAGEAERRSIAAKADALASIEAAGAASTELMRQQSNLDAHALEVAEEQERLEGVRTTLINAKTALEAESKALTQRSIQIEESHKEALAALAQDRADIAEYQKRAQSNMDEALAMKAEYEAKLAKIKALTE